MLLAAASDGNERAREQGASSGLKHITVRSSTGGEGQVAGPETLARRSVDWAHHSAHCRCLEGGAGQAGREARELPGLHSHPLSTPFVWLPIPAVLASGACISVSSGQR